MGDNVIPLQQLSANFDGIVNEIKTLQSQDKVLAAYDRAELLENSMRVHFQTLQQQGGDPNVVNWLHNAYQQTQPLLQSLGREKQEISRLMNEFNNYNGWTMTRDSNGIRTFYRHEEPNPVHSLRMEGIINAPLFNVLAIIIETDLYPTWIPMIKECAELARLSTFRKLVYMRTELPWPIWSRDMCVFGYGVDMLDKDAVIVIVRGCNEGDSFQPPPVPNKHVRMEVTYAGIWIQPISANDTKVIFITNFDPKLAHIPYWLLNSVTHNSSYMMFEKLRNAAQTVPGSEYERRINSKPDVYGRPKERVSQYFGAKQPLQPQAFMTSTPPSVVQRY